MAGLLAIGHSPFWVFGLLTILFGIHPIVDEIFSRTDAAARWTKPYALPHLVHRLPVYLCIPVHAAILLHALRTGTADPLQAFSSGVICGVSGGILGIAAGHELMHSRRRGERFAGSLLLHLINYPHFYIEHLWHHVAIATPEDSDTAREGESLYRFWARSIPQGYAHCWKWEAQKGRKRGYGWYSPRNPMLRATALQLSAWVLVTAIWGPLGVTVFAIQGLVTLLMLKWINYVEHYGLDRRRADGGVDPVSDLDSWDSTNPLTNWGLLNLGFHSQHHLGPKTEYHDLPRTSDRWNTLPEGYSAMMVRALFPGHWRDYLAPLVRRQRELRDQRRSLPQTHRGGRFKPASDVGTQAGIPMDFLDYGFLAASRSDRSLDFAAIVTLKKETSLEELLRGARFASDRFPKANQRARGARWVPEPEPWSIEAASFASLSERDEKISGFIHRSFDLSRGRGIRELYLRSSAGLPAVLVVRMHHALGDGLSLLLWLNAQLLGRTDGTEHPLELKRHPTGGIRKSRFSFDRPSDGLRFEAAISASGKRRWRCFEIARPRRLFDDEPYSYNDLLSAALLRAAREWNSSVGAAEQRLSLWIPVNVRRHAFDGFGNGSSRIRVYDHVPEHCGYREFATALRAQAKTTREDGEWNIPERADRLLRWPGWITRPLLRAYANRPGLDRGTILFSHIEKFPGQEEFFSALTSLEFVVQLHGNHPLAVTVVSRDGVSNVGFTWDEARVSDIEAEKFSQLVERHCLVAFQEHEHGAG